MVSRTIRSMSASCLATLLSLSLGACYRGTDGGVASGSSSAEGGPGGADGSDSDSAGDPGADSGPPGNQGEGDAENPQGRQLRRMTATQFHNSLAKATGQPWPSFDEYAATMGKADFAEITAEGRELSVTFDKFAHDAANYTCDAAVDADLSEMPPASPVILRHATVADRDATLLRTNVNYLALRFLGQVMRDDDARVDPWLTVLTTPPTEGEFTDEIMAERWKAVCIGLVTHPDFVTY